MGTRDYANKRDTLAVFVFGAEGNTLGERLSGLAKEVDFDGVVVVAC